MRATLVTPVTMFLLILTMAACGGGPAPVVALPMSTSVAPADPAALRSAVDAYYTASDAAGMRAAVAAAKAAGPDTALYHEIAAELAQLEDRHAEELEHRISAVLDPANDQPMLHLHAIGDIRWTLPERVRIEAVLRGLWLNHPDPETRATAAWMAGHAAHMRDDGPTLDAALASLGYRPKLAIIGTWDNDQGKGFDAELAPERELDLSRRYSGKLMEVGWRTDYPLDPRGKIDLGQVLSPTHWQVAYAATAIKAEAEGDYELRVGTSAPIKVWVNDTLVFQNSRISTWLFDGVVLPVKLRAGANQVLIKTANQEGAWLLTARVTRPGGEAIMAGLADVPMDTPYVKEGPKTEPVSIGALLESHLKALPPGPRRAVVQAAWAADIGLTATRATLAEAYNREHPDSLIGRALLASALWENQERGRTADLLNGLVQSDGEALPMLALAQARFWREQNLNIKARDLLTKVRAQHPDRAGAARMLAELFEKERWYEDRCATLEAVDAQWPDWPAVMYDLASCYESLRFYPRAGAIYARVLKALPNSMTALKNLHWLNQGNDRFPEAEAFARRLTKAWPSTQDAWDRLGETLRRSGDRAGAAAAWQHLIDMAPTSAVGYGRLAQLALQAGELAPAVALLKEALARDPDNESLANRVSYLAPSEEGPWVADVPSDADIDTAVARADQIGAQGGTDIVYLMDDEVTALAADGSTTNFVTMVALAVNQAGRDRLTQMSVRGGGRARIMAAYAVQGGRRVEASSIRGRSVRFRQLDVGSTVVLQYRIDERPDGFLAGHMGRQWWFQAPGVQTEAGRWVMWMPKGGELLQEVHGEVKFEERVEGDLKRVSWTATNTPPVVLEPGMPTLQEVAAYVVVSTVPDWHMFLKWEIALLEDAFRQSPELEALAKKIFADAPTPQVKIERIHEYLMTNIRYQQDYEHRIAGVKPHAAPVVVARQYGDCKDKAVLFITLAELAGLEVDFALVRTRDAGPVQRGVPMQQFNHAIVYVPAQEGIAEGRFYDPTVDALDVDVLRQDDQGTWSLVLDPRKGVHEWRQIPYQAASMDYTLADTHLTLDDDGGASGTVRLEAKGRVGSAFRRGARNPEQLAQLLEQQVGRTFAGARVTNHEVVQVDSVREPAQVKLEIDAPSLARREGQELRLKVPIGWSPQQYFTLSERRHPLLLGSPRTLRWEVSLALPKGAKIKRVPSSVKLELPCLTLEREVELSAGKVVAKQSVAIKCERIPQSEYARYRTEAEKMIRVLDEELVLTVLGAKSKGRAATAAR